MSVRLILFFSSLSSMVLGFVLQPAAIGYMAKSIWTSPIILLYNYIPVFILTLLFFFLSGNIWIGAFSGGFTVTLFSLINRYKIIHRDDPFVPMDIPLMKEAYFVSVDSQIPINIFHILLPALIVLIFTFLLVFFKVQKLKPLLRLAGVVLCIGAALLSNKFIYSSKAVFEKLPVNGTEYHMTNIFNSKGFVYSFLYYTNAYRIERPEGYNKEAVMRAIEEYSHVSARHLAAGEGAAEGQEMAANGDVAGEGAAELPHIIMIMGEAFSDISETQALRFEGENDPLYHYKRLQDENILNGYIITPAFGGGTANTEFESLTGCITANICEGSTSCFRLIRKKMLSLPHVLKSLGYDTVGIHPGYSWFYNRKNVYEHLGFDQSIFSDEFDQDKTKGYYISEAATAEKVIEEFQRHTEANSEKPIFIFNVTIQNHGPYTYSKYGVKTPPTFETGLKLSDEAVENLTSYFSGIKDMDNAIKTLTDYFKETGEPVIMVYYGDHLPGLGQDYLAYKEIGYGINTDGTPQEYLNIYKTPFFVWSSSEAKNIISVKKILSTGQLQMPSNSTIGAGYLPGLILEIIGHEEASPFLSFTNSLRKEVPIITKRTFMVGNEYLQELPESLAEDVTLYKYWQYYLMTE